MFQDHYTLKILHSHVLMNTTQHMCAIQWVLNKCMLMITWFPSFLDTSWLKTYSIYIFTVVSVIFLLCLSALLFCFLRHRQKKQGLPNNKRQQQRPEERLNLATNGLEMTPDIVADDRLPEDRWTETWTPVAGDLQEVTYIQLDHHSLTQRAVGAVTSQSTDMAESSTYAAIIRH